MSDAYEVISLDPDDLEKAVQSKKIAALRADGYRMVGHFMVEDRGKTRIAFIMEPPIQTELEVVEVVQAKGISAIPGWWWKVAAFALIVLVGIIGVMVLGQILG